MFGSKPNPGSFVFPQESRPSENQRIVETPSIVQQIANNITTFRKEVDRKITLNHLEKDLITIVACPYLFDFQDNIVKALEEVAMNIICKYGFKVHLIEAAVEIFSNNIHFTNPFDDNIRKSFINLLEKYPNNFDHQLLQDMKEIVSIHSAYEEAKRNFPTTGETLDQGIKTIGEYLNAWDNFIGKRNKFRDTYGELEASKVMKALRELKEAYIFFKKETEKLKEQCPSDTKNLTEISVVLSAASNKYWKECHDFKKRSEEYTAIERENLIDLLFRKITKKLSNF